MARRSYFGVCPDSLLVSEVLSASVLMGSQIATTNRVKLDRLLLLEARIVLRDALRVG